MQYAPFKRAAHKYMHGKHFKGMHHFMCICIQTQSEEVCIH